MTRQCKLIDLNRSTLYYEAKPIDSYDVKVMRRIDEIYTNISSTYGYRFMHKQLLQEGFAIGVNKVNRLMNQMGLQAIFQEASHNLDQISGTRFILICFVRLK